MDDETQPVTLETTMSAFQDLIDANQDDQHRPSHRPLAEDCEVRTWFERDRRSVVVVDTTTDMDDTVAEWWDDEVDEAVEDGFLDPRNWSRSAIDYCRHLGLVRN